MNKFDWDEYKEFRKYTHKEDKLDIAIDFIKSYYNIYAARDLYEILSEDEIGKLLLEKRDINEAEDLENYMFQK